MKPLKFKPYYKKVIWGGTKIASFKNVSLPDDDIGESWEISGLEGHESVVAEGEYEGKTLNELIALFGETLLGESSIRRHGRVFPLLLKIIDANRDLSLQVHPDDAMASKLGQPFGKTEMWYVVENEPDAKIFSGFERRVTPPELVGHIRNNTLMTRVKAHASEPGTLFYLPAGQIHAIGKGNLVVEIQQASDVTYRIYDYGRIDKNGKTRPLHVDEAIEALDFTPGSYVKKTDMHRPGLTELHACRDFRSYQITVGGSHEVENANGSFMILIAVDGSAEIVTENDVTELRRGHSLLLPAEIRRFTVRGKGRLLAFTL